MGLPSTFVWTHDSIGLGEDGPTHQPVEHIASLRLMPGLAMVRPADANETAAAWSAILESAKPAGIVLSRQDLVVHASAQVARENVARGGYIISDAAGAQATIIATGSEVDLAMQAQAALAANGKAVRVVSMPCTEWFDAQSIAYRSSVIDPTIPAVAVEAGATAGWYKYVGLNGAVIGIDRFGASADPSILFAECGVTVDAVIAAVTELI
jgi:transketolase